MATEQKDTGKLFLEKCITILRYVRKNEKRYSEQTAKWTQQNLACEIL